METEERIVKAENKVLAAEYERVLTIAQAGEIKNKVEIKTKELCIQKYGKDIYAAYKAINHRIWGKLKRELGYVSRYNYIRRKDFDLAMMLVDGITLYDIERKNQLKPHCVNVRFPISEQFSNTTNINKSCSGFEVYKPS